MKRKILSGLLLLGILALVSLPSDKVYAEEEYVLIDDESDEICSMELEEEVQLPNDNDVLFEEYAAREFGLDEYDIEVQFSNQCRDNLNEYEKNVYDVILSAAEDIANGNRSSAIIEITYADIFGEGKLTYTADELEGYTGDNLRTKLGYRLISEANSGTVIKALLNDCPYEFYWFDKLVGSVGNTLTLSASISADGTKVTVNKDAVLFTFKYAVEESYASDLYIADTEKTSLVRTAVSNAKGIVAAAASKGDYDKLMYYADEICDMVYYDTSAVEGSSAGTQTDCDPWQLIYVFDGDNSTNVVCEGYAKAFQYLCDQSSFEGNTYSYIITGYAGNADRVSKARAYAHMWNFVHMDDERVYYMDVTWADGGAGIDSLIQEADVSTDTYFEMDIQGTMKKYIFSDDTIRTYTSNQLKLSLVAYGEEAPATPTPTAVPTPTVTPSATATPTPTATVKPSVTPMPTATPTVAPTVAPVVTPTPTVTPTTGSTMKQVNGTWYYYVNGVNDTSYTGMVQYNGAWYYIQRGVLKWGYTGMVQYNGIWYYIQNSTLKLGYTGMVQYNGTWYYIQNSTLKWGYTGMVQYNGTWYYVQNSTLKWGYTGMVQYNGTWYYIQNSTLKWGYTGLVMYGNKWYYIQNSTLKWGVTTLVQYDKDKYWYYVNNSCVDFSYTGYFTYGGTRYRVVNGRVQ